MAQGIKGSRPTCCIDGCDRLAQSRGWCTMHYQRWARRGDPLLARPTGDKQFWARVEKMPDDGCWLMGGSADRDGYRKFGRNSIRAHRYALEQALGRPLTPGMLACHTCDNPACVRNDDVGFYEVNGILRPRRGHLWEGTHRDNHADRGAKGRTAYGERNGARLHPERWSRGEGHPRARFTEGQIRDIRVAAADGVPLTILAVEHDVTPAAIHSIIHRKTWKHVD